MIKACEVCRGACCESLVIETSIHPKVDEWLQARGTILINSRVEIETQCPSLTSGKCSRYITRPEICKEYMVGGDECRETIKRRRKNWEDIFSYL